MLLFLGLDSQVWNACLGPLFQLLLLLVVLFFMFLLPDHESEASLRLKFLEVLRGSPRTPESLL